MMKDKTTTLTAEERSAYERALNFYQYTGKAESECVRLAWADVQSAFPRLKDFDRCD